jgi:hypothetical protein
MKTISAENFLRPTNANLEGVKPKVFADISALIPGYPKEQIATFQEDWLLLPDRVSIAPAKRLVVLIPPGEVDEIALARKVWKLAAKSLISVLYLVLAPDPEYVPYLRRRLANLAASTSQGEVTSSTKITVGDDWAKAVKAVLLPGDLLVSVLGHRVSHRLIGSRPLGDALCRAFDIPVYLLGSLRVGSTPPRSSMIRSFIGWSLSIGTIIGAGVFQIGVSRADVEPYSTILIVISALVEIFLIWKINEWLG